MARRTLPSGRTGARTWALRAALVLVSTALALLIAGAVLRRGPAQAVRRAEGPKVAVHDPLLGWRLRPEARERHRTAEYDVAVRVNSQGFRADREYAEVPPPGVTRVVAVGDSFTYGQGVEAHEAFPALLERSLPAAEVVNLGVAGYGTDQQLLMLESRGLRFRPDVVVLGLYMTNVFRNDDPVHGPFAKPVFRRGADGALVLANVPVPAAGAAAVPRETGLVARSRLLGKVWDRLEYRGFGEVWEVTEEILERFAAVSGKAGARLVVVVIPTEGAIHGGSVGRALQAQSLRRLMATLPEGAHVTAVDTTPALLAAREKGELLYFSVDGHLTAAGHRVVAREILRTWPSIGPQGETAAQSASRQPGR
jgi:GDSL-like Lipase/Acylhydrolase family